MLPLKSLLLWVVLASALSGLACDRINELKDRLLGSSTSGSDVHPALDAIRTLYESGQYDGALQKVAELTQSDPGSVDAYYYRGLCYLAKAGEPDLKAPFSADEEKSLEGFRRALAINPRHAPSNVGIGDLYSRHVPKRRHRGGSKDSEDPYVLALGAYEQAVTIDPRLPEAQYHYGRFLEKTGQLERAEQAYKAAVEAAATVPEIAPDYYMAYGRFLAGPADRLDEALDQFELAKMFRADDVTIQQEMAIIHSRVGLRHLEKQEYMLAENALKLGYEMFPDKNIPEAQKTADALAQLRSIRRR